MLAPMRTSLTMTGLWVSSKGRWYQSLNPEQPARCMTEAESEDKYLHRIQCRMPILRDQYHALGDRLSND
jgi:hypothetical protein